jgi:hypothetical protein
VKFNLLKNALNLSNLIAAATLVSFVASQSAFAIYDPNAKCYITQKQCVAYPQYSGRTFEDVYFTQHLNDPTSQQGLNGERCRMRAVDYSLWCGNPAGTTTTAEYRVPAKKYLASKTYTGGNACLVTVALGGNAANPYCPRANLNLSNFHDIWGYSYPARPWSDDSASYCEQRASDYLAWCLLPKGSKVTTTFFQKGVLTGTYVKEKTQ